VTDSTSVLQTDVDRLSSQQASDLLRRLCEHLGIAFSANRVPPSLADLSESGEEIAGAEQLNAIGKHFGIRFRKMTGSIRELLQTVNDSGPAVVYSDQNSGELEPYLVLGTRGRNRIEICHDGKDQIESVQWLKRNIKTNEGSGFQWLLVQPMLAANNASRYHYKTGTQSKPLTPLKRFIAFLKPEASDIRAIVVFSVVIGLLSLTLPLAVEAVVNTIAYGQYLQPLVILSLIVAVFLGFRAGLNVLMTIVTEIIQRKLFVRTVEDLSYRLTRVPLAVWRKKHGPELVNRFFDIVTVQKVTSKLLLDTLMLGLQTVIGLSVLAFYHPFLLGYDIGLLAIMTIVLYVIGRGAIRSANAESQSKYEMAAWLQEIVRHPSTYKFNGGLGFAINRADELAAQYIGHRQRHFRILIRQFSFAMMMQVFAATILLALGGYLVIEGEMTLGQLVAAELIVTVILGSFAKLGKDLESFYDLMASMNKLGKLFDLPVEAVDKLQLARSPGAYQLSLVDLQLFNHSDKPSNIELAAGKTHAVYGMSELKREKLVDVLVGQEKPALGYVLLNDYRVDSIAAESLQEKISLVRDIELFAGTIDDNLRMGRENVGSAETNEIIEQLGLRDTVAALPNGFATEVNISGYPLSQGEAIRLIVARALIAKPGVLFIDGLLDRLSDDAVDDLLPRLTEFADSTTIVVTTGRKAIASWAEDCLDAREKAWQLGKFQNG